MQTNQWSQYLCEAKKKNKFGKREIVKATLKFFFHTLGRHKLKYVSLYELKSFFRHSSHRSSINDIRLNSSVTSSNSTLTSDEICSENQLISKFNFRFAPITSQKKAVLTELRLKVKRISILMNLIVTGHTI